MLTTSVETRTVTRKVYEDITIFVETDITKLLNEMKYFPEERKVEVTADNEDNGTIQPKLDEQSNASLEFYLCS